MTKMKTIKYLLTACSVVLFSSCIKEFRISLPDTGKKIVINALFDNRGVISATVTRSMKPDGSDWVEELTTANVSLYKDGNFVETLRYHKEEGDTMLGRFFSTTVPVSGARYRLTVEYPEMTPVEASTVMPPAVYFQADTPQWVVWNVPKDTINTIRFHFRIRFDDPQGTTWYMLKIGFPIYKIDTLTGSKEFQAWQYGQILTADLTNPRRYYDNGLIFSDDQFTGKEKTISGMITVGNKPDIDDVPWPPLSEDYYAYYPYVVEKRTLHIELYTLSEDTYNFYTSIMDKLETEDDFYAQPAVVYSNVEHGLGIFGASYVSIQDVVVSYPGH